MSDWSAILRRFSGTQVLVLGDVMLDRYTWGEAERVSPEAPVLVLRSASEEVRLGGAASVAALLRGLDADVRLAGVVGDDAAGHTLRALLREAGIDESLVVHDAARVTTCKHRFLGRSSSRQAHQVLRVDSEERRPVDSVLEDRVARAMFEHLRDCDVVLISDYAKGLCTPHLLRQVLAAANARGLPVVVDPGRGKSYAHYAGATIVKPNRGEAEEASGIGIQSPRDALAAGHELCRRYGFSAALVTLDRDGLAIAWANGEGEWVPARARAVCDITGAGDMVLAILGLCVGRQVSLADAARLANLAAGLEVERQGVAVVTRAELARAGRCESLADDGGPAARDAVHVPADATTAAAGQHRPADAGPLARRAGGVSPPVLTVARDFIPFPHHRPADAGPLAGAEPRLGPAGGVPKVVSLDELVTLAAAYRQLRRTLVFTNGCFDLLHVGHVTYLQEAARQGDMLIVGLNSDAGIQRLKGPDRPVIGQQDRATMLAALGCVAHVVVFDEDTPHRLLAAIRPDVLVKGGTYAVGQVVGREVVESYGGRVCVVGHVPSVSTTGLISRIRTLESLSSCHESHRV